MPSTGAPTTDALRRQVERLEELVTTLLLRLDDLGGMSEIQIQRQRVMLLIRKRIEKMVLAYTLARGDDTRVIWSKLFHELDRRYGLDVHGAAIRENTPLDVVEWAGLMPELYVITRDLCL